MPNPLALLLVKQHEGCKLTAYPDVTGIPTIGWGTTGADVKLGTTWTQEKADARLAADVEKTQAAIRKALNEAHAPPLTNEQEAALISFAYNMGIYALTKSTLFDYVRKGAWLPAAREFMRWDHAGQREIRGLLLRRLDEAKLFVQGSA